MIDYKKYHDQGFGEWQLEEIKLADKNGVSIELIDKWLANLDYDPKQMSEVREGLVNRVDVSWFADTNIPAESMAQIRKKLQSENGLLTESETRLNKAKTKKLDLDNKDHQKLHVSLVAMSIGMCALALVISFLTILVIVFLLKR